MTARTDSNPPLRPPPSLELPRPRRSAGGLVVSVLLHAVLVALIVAGAIRIAPPAAGDLMSGIAGGGGGGGGGGERVSYISLPPAGAPAAVTPEPAVAVVRPPVEKTPVVAPPARPVEEAPVPSEAAPIATADPSAGAGIGAGTGTGSESGSGGGSGGGQGGGVGTGTGLGDGPGTGGDGGDIRPPVLSGWAPPLDRPSKELRGATVRVTFWVGADGRVERYTTDPEIRDNGYRRKWDELIRAMRFKPARTRAGLAVPATFEATFVLPS